MAKSTKSATELAEGLAGMVAGIGEDIQKAAISETREYVAKEIENQFLQPTGRKTYGGKTPDESILDTLREYLADEVPRLRQALNRFDDSGEVSEDFRAGILFAVRLFADETYDY